MDSAFRLMRNKTPETPTHARALICHGVVCVASPGILLEKGDGAVGSGPETDEELPELMAAETFNSPKLPYRDIR